MFLFPMIGSLVYSIRQISTNIYFKQKKCELYIGYDVHVITNYKHKALARPSLVYHTQLQRQPPCFGFGEPDQTRLDLPQTGMWVQ